MINTNCKLQKPGGEQTGCGGCELKKENRVLKAQRDFLLWEVKKYIAGEDEFWSARKWDEDVVRRRVKGVLDKLDKIRKDEE